MAEAVAAVLWEVGSAWATDAAVFALSNAAVINATVAIAASSAYGAQQKRKARAAYNASLKDREVMIRSAVAPRRVIYGRDKVSGPIVYAESTGDKGQFLHLVLVLAAHECDAIEEIWFNDIKLPTLSGGGFVTSGEFARSATTAGSDEGSVPPGGVFTLSVVPDSVTAVSVRIGTGVGADAESAPAAGWAHTAGTNTITGLTAGDYVFVNYETSAAVQPVRIIKHLGGSGQVADATLVGESAGQWTSSHVGAGMCYLYVRLEYDTEIFGQVGVPNISAVVRGKKVFDPRSSTTVWSQNDALCVADWLRDSRYGMAAASGEVPDAEVIVAANICDETIDLALGGATTQPRYTYNGSFTTDEAPRDVLADLLSGMAGNCVWTQGRWLVRAGSYRASSLAITADHLAGRGVTILPKATRSDLFNAVRVVYRDPAQGWAEVQAPLITNATYEAQDGGRRIVRTIQLSSAMDAWRAQRLGKIELERARQALTVQLVTNLRAYDLSPTDTTALTLDRYGFASKPFAVAERTWSSDGNLAYTLRETAAGVWAWNYGEATVVDLAPDTTLPNPYSPPATIAGLTVASGTAHLLRLGDGTILSRAWLQWTQTTEVFVLQGGRIEAQWKRADMDDWQVGPPMPGDSINTYLSPMPDSAVVLFRVRAVNASGRSGAWTTINALILGKSGPPSNVAGLAYEIKPSQVVISWTMCTDADYADTELREGASWAAGDLLAVVAGREYQHPRPANGTYTVWAAHRDTSGNYSAAPASLSVTVDDSIDPTASGAELLQLTATGFAFVFADAAATTSASPTITFTAALQGVSGTATFVATARNAAGTSLGTIALGGAGNTRTLTAAQFVSLGALTTRYIEVSASITGTSGTLTDSMTVYRGDDGSDAVQGVLSNEAHTIPTASDGTGGVFTGSGTTIKVFEGIADLTYDGAGTANGTWAVSKAGTGITPGSTTDSGVFATIGDHSAMTTDQASITYTITGKTFTGGAFSFTKVQSFAKSKAGALAQALQLTATGFAFVFADAAATTSTSPLITFTAALQNITGPATITAEAFNTDNTTLGAVTLGGSGNVRTMTAAQFNAAGATTVRTVKVTATLGALADFMTVYRGDDGSDAVQVVLSNENHTLPAANDGTVSSYAGSGTTIRLFEGINELDFDGVGAANGTWTATRSVTTGAVSSPGPITAAGLQATVADHAGMTTPSATITYSVTGKTATGAAISLSQVQSLSKSIAGADSTIYWLGSTSPVIVKDAPDAATSGAHVNITVTGKQSTGGTTSNYGFVTVTGNGDTEATTATATSITTAIANGAGKTSYTVKLYNQATVAGATLRDSMTIPVVFKGVSGTNGISALSAVLSNDAHTIPTDSVGANGNFAGSGTTIRLFEGATELTCDIAGGGTSNGTWTATRTGTSITPGAISDSGTFATMADHSNMTADVALVTVSITGKRLDGTAISTSIIQSLSKARSGVSGGSISIDSNAGAVFISSGPGTTFTPSSITLSRSLRNVTDPSAAGTVWTNPGGGFTGSLTTLIAGGITAFSPAQMSADRVVLMCTVTDSVTSLVYTDSITVIKSRDGLGVYLTNDSVVLPASTAGAISSYTGASGTMKVTNAAGEITGGLAFTIVGYSGFASSYSAPGVSQDGGNITVNATSGAYTVTAGVTNAATIATVTLRATYTDPLGGSKTFDRVFTITKAVTGATGSTGPTGGTGSTGNTGQSNHRVYKANAFGTPPSTPGTTTSGATPAGWSATPVTIVAGEAQWQSDGTTPAGSTTTTWAAPYQSYLKVGQLSAISADIGTITAGDLTAAKFRTANSGARILINDTVTNATYGNKLVGLNASGGEMFKLDASAGLVTITSDQVSTTSGALRVDTASFSGCAISATGPTGVPAIIGTANSAGTGVKGVAGTSGDGIKGESSSGSGVYGFSTTGPGVRASSLRIDQTPATGAAVASFSGVKPGSDTTNSWITVNLNGTTYYIPVWA